MNLTHVLLWAAAFIVALWLWKKIKNALGRAALRHSRVEIDYYFAKSHIGNNVLDHSTPETIVAMVVIALEGAKQHGLVLTGQPAHTMTKGKGMRQVNIHVPASFQGVRDMLEICVTVALPSSR